MGMLSVFSPCVRFCVRGLFAGLVLMASARAEPRVWTDVQGRTILAELMEKKADAVVLKRDDGLLFTLPLDRLINSDRQFVADWQAPRLEVPSVEAAMLMVRT